MLYSLKLWLATSIPLHQDQTLHWYGTMLSLFVQSVWSIMRD